MGIERVIAEKVRALGDAEIADLLGDRFDITPRIGGERPAKPAPLLELRFAAPKTSAPKAGKKQAAKKPAGSAATAKKGEKRDPGALVRLGEELVNHIKANPGQGVEQIAKALGTSTKELALPIRKLLASRHIRTEGVKRATRYYPRAGANVVAAADVN